MALTFTPETVGGGFQSTDNIQANFQAIRTLLQDALSPLREYSEHYEFNTRYEL